MPATQRKHTSQSSYLPNPKITAKTLSKDAGKFVTIPKNSSTSVSSDTSLNMAQNTTVLNGQVSTPSSNTNGAPPTVNRKKQKRRAKQAARAAAEIAQGAQMSGGPSSGEVKRQMQELEARFRETGLDEQYDDDDERFDPADDNAYYSDEDGDAYSGSYGHDGSSTNGYAMPATNSSGKKQKKKKKSRSAPAEQTNRAQHGANGSSHNHVSLPLPPLQSPPIMQRGPGISKEKIWNTSSQEERERIKEFWLSLGEDERKSLVKVEKDAVLKKMKEQQKHSCSCTVCGRKRTAIEEELEVLYDAYYEELEQYANHQGGDGPPPMLPPRRFGAMSGLQPPNRLPPIFNGPQPSRGRIEQLGDDEDEEGDEEYSEDDADEDDYSDEEPEEIPRSHATDFFNFGNSLTVQGGILTVADDLLKNDGKKFIEMMEQLAERRMAREEDAKEQYANVNYGHPANGSMHPHSHGHLHNHPPPPEEDDYDDEDDDEDEYDSQEEDYDEEEMDTMTEEQRMEEGRRMFQIFAARMFEQRVLTAYKEKVAKERQQKLLEELEEESRADSQKKAKRAKDAQKKKEKMLEKKRALAEEKARKEAEKAAEEALLREIEEKRAEEQRLKREENRKKKEAQKKADEEERVRKEAEKQRRIQEQRERQAEQERKQREAKEREKREKEELRRQALEAKEAKDKEAKERKEKHEREKREKEAKVKADKEARELQKREELTAQQAAVQAAQSVAQASRRSNQVPTPNLSHAVASPHIPVAIPAVPKAPTPIKLRTNSQQDVHPIIPITPSGKHQSISPNSSTPLPNSPGPIGPPGKTPMQHPLLQHPQANPPIHSALKGPPGIPPSPFASMQPMHGGFQPGLPMAPPGFARPHHDQMFPHQQPMGSQFRPLPMPNGGMPLFQPGFNMHHMPQGRGFPMHGPPGFPQPSPNGMNSIGQLFGAPKEMPPSQAHSRNQSGSFDGLSSTTQAQPIARPAPIGRPSSIVHGSRRDDKSSATDSEETSKHLGSSALLDDSDEPLNVGVGARRSSAAPGNPSRQNFLPPPFGMDRSDPASMINTFGTWNTPPNPFASSSLPGSNGFGGGWNTHLNMNNSFGIPPYFRPSQPRSVAVRLMICMACQNLQSSTQDGWLDIASIKSEVSILNPHRDEPVSGKELLDICDTEGNQMNGGGTFEIRLDSNGKPQIHYVSDSAMHDFRSVGAPGEIGSPMSGGVGISASRNTGPPGRAPIGGF